MAINTRIVNGSHTEIYVGGGNFITQAVPTNFHQFFARKILTAKESIEDYREVTAAERNAIEAEDAKWEAPDTALIAQFNYLANRVVSNYGGYNKATGFFENGTIKDITTAQARKMLLSAASWVRNIDEKTPSGLFAEIDIRAAFPLRLSGGGQGYSNLDRMFLSSQVEEVYFINGFAQKLEKTFYGCNKLKKITIPTNQPIHSVYLPFVNCSALETIVGLKTSVSLELTSSPKLSLDSVSEIVRLAANSSPITITLHPDAYARVTDDIFAAAAAKNITIATP